MTADGVEKIKLLHGAHSSSQADIWLVESPDWGRCVLRDYSTSRALPFRGLCRWAVAREIRVHQILEGVEGVPRLLEVLDRDRYLMDYIEGEPLSDKKTLKNPGGFFEALETILDRAHDRKLAHGDLRNKNVMVDPEERPYLIDFSTAWWGTSWWRLPLFQIYRGIDARRFAKSKQKYAPDLLTEEERARLEETPWYRRIGRLYRHGIYRWLRKSRK